MFGWHSLLFTHLHWTNLKADAVCVWFIIWGLELLIIWTFMCTHLILSTFPTWNKQTIPSHGSWSNTSLINVCAVSSNLFKFLPCRIYLYKVLTHILQREWKLLLSSQWIFNAEKGCFNKIVCRPVKDMLDQEECLGGASVASVKEKYQPVNTKRDNNKAGRKTGRKRERRRDSSACLCGRFAANLFWKPLILVATVVSVS